MSLRDGLTHEQNAALFPMIMSVIRSACYCHRLKDAKCARCRNIDKVSEAFPESWLHAADIAARVGGTE